MDLAIVIWKIQLHLIQNSLKSNQIKLYHKGVIMQFGQNLKFDSQNHRD